MDYQLFKVINSLAGHVLFIDRLMVLISKYGLFILLLIIIGLWLSGSKREKKTVLKALLSATLALGLNQLIGSFYFRARPFSAHPVELLLPKSMDPSFPSDHAAAATGLTAATFGLNSIVKWSMLIISILLFISRVYVGLHYPGDVFGGMLTGILATIVVNRIWSHLNPIADLIIGWWNRIFPRLRS
ncbi:MAG: phosphatase PAP2 family protein [Bacillota bacterium]